MNGLIMAAGTSSRMAPLSYECPKALLEIRGEILIERQIRQMQAGNIKEIVVVIGYKKELFYYLKEKFGVILIDNPDYERLNNYSTLYHGRDYIQNTYISCGDYYFVENPFIEKRENSCYALEYSLGETDEWCVDMDASGCIKQVAIGGKNQWFMKGWIYFTEDFSKKLMGYIISVYKEGIETDIYWEDIYIRHIDELMLYGTCYEKDEILEFDSLEDLRAKEPSYIKDSRSRILKSIADSLHCSEDKIINIIPVKKNQESIGFEFKALNNYYSYIYEEKKLCKKEIV